MIQYQYFDPRNLVEGDPLHFLDPIVGQVDDLQLGSVLPDHIPGQLPDGVTLEDEDLGLPRHVLELVGVSESGVGAVGNEDLPF